MKSELVRRRIVSLAWRGLLLMTAVGISGCVIHEHDDHHPPHDDHYYHHDDYH